MIGGIFETIGKTLGIGKEKYFLELDDAAEKGVENLKETASKAAKTTVETVKGVSADVAEKVQSATDEVTDDAESVAKKGKTKTKAAVADAKKAAANDKKAVKNEAKKVAAKGADQKSAQTASPDNGAVPAPEVKPSTQSEPRSAEEIIVEAIAAASKKTDSEGNAVDDGPTNFATDHLMPTSNGSRRRPGPSFASFKGMAKEVNPRLRG